MVPRRHPTAIVTLEAPLSADLLRFSKNFRNSLAPFLQGLSPEPGRRILLMFSRPCSSTVDVVVLTSIVRYEREGSEATFYVNFVAEGEVIEYVRYTYCEALPRLADGRWCIAVVDTYDWRALNDLFSLAQAQHSTATIIDTTVS